MVCHVNIFLYCCCIVIINKRIFCDEMNLITCADFVMSLLIIHNDEMVHQEIGIASTSERAAHLKSMRWD